MNTVFTNEHHHRSQTTTFPLTFLNQERQGIPITLSLVYMEVARR